jgi:ABC-2 type transport system permease protein
LATGAITSLDQAVTDKDQARADAALGDLEDATDQLSLSARAVTAASDRLMGDRAAATGDDLTGVVDELRQDVTDLRANLQAQDVGTRLARIRQLLDTIDQRYDRLTDVDPGVLVRPFRSEVQLAVHDVGKVTDWYAPAAVVLMLQQFGVAFGALTFVRERQLGITDIFRVAPINATETLVGKYVAYLVVGGAIGAVLTALVVLGLGVPMSATAGDVAIVMGLTLFASIGLGFVISLTSDNDAQAVQYTMILLLASLFFSGFFLSVGQLEGVARYLGWLLPVTYGMQLLRDVMLRGAPPDRYLVAGLATYGVVMFLLALFGARRRLAVA